MSKLQKLSLELLADNNRPQPPSPTLGAFVHVGKTGGSTLTQMLKFGCHSFVVRECKYNTQRLNQRLTQSAVSNLTTYFHTPDMNRNRKGLYSRHLFNFYLFTIRDPFERAVSAFLYSHPENRIAEIPYKEWKRKYPEKFNNMLKTQNESKIFEKFSKGYKRKAHIYPRQYKSLFSENGVNLIAYNCFPTIEKFATHCLKKTI
ncbi:hypothetical protein CTEN210_18682 [Chaetoceros tenuissimus]|uniref:Sulfotransferase family protein n=1 Tax=Chaetoceros tenuissimus TaxID=426638 RepID=A0AAD3HG99_9STRA|nr:hypothetical protein CTEN210_18682 [Chaetoceros tenuissimus]